MKGVGWIASMDGDSHTLAELPTSLQKRIKTVACVAINREITDIPRRPAFTTKLGIAYVVN
jgi:hypothetical protein